MRIEDLLGEMAAKRGQQIAPGSKAYADCAKCGEAKQRLDDVGAAEVSGDTQYVCTKCGASLLDVRSIGGGQYGVEVHGGMYFVVPPAPAD